MTNPAAPNSLNVYKRVTIIRHEDDKVTFEDSSGTTKSLSVKDFRGVLSAAVRLTARAVPLFATTFLVHSLTPLYFLPLSLSRLSKHPKYRKQPKVTSPCRRSMKWKRTTKIYPQRTISRTRTFDTITRRKKTGGSESIMWAMRKMSNG